MVFACCKCSDGAWCTASYAALLLCVCVFFVLWGHFLEKTSLDISCELSAKQTIHMKYQDLFCLKKKKMKKKKNNNFKMTCLLQILLDSLRVSMGGIKKKAVFDHVRKAQTQITLNITTV